MVTVTMGLGNAKQIHQALCDAAHAAWEDAVARRDVIANEYGGLSWFAKSIWEADSLHQEYMARNEELEGLANLMERRIKAAQG